MSSKQDARPRDPSHPGPSSAANGSASARKRPSPEPSAGPSEPERKKSKKGKGRHTAFNPKPVHREVEPEPEAGDDEDIPLPPPPQSVKATARQRMKDKAATMASPAPRRRGGSRPPEPAPADESEEASESSRPQPRQLFKSTKSVRSEDKLQFRKIAKPRASMAPPPSPGPSSAAAYKRGAPRRSMRPAEVLSENLVPLPPTDTPVIIRNRALREKTARRSSRGMRGGRGSSSFDKGEPSYPHASISHTQFYKHFPPERPEPQKTAWLISWCGKRALEERTDTSTRKGRERAANPEQAEIDRLLGSVLDDLSFKLAQGKVDTNVFAPPGEAFSAMPIRPHPRNVENRKAQEKENAVIKKMKEEELAWSHISNRANKEQEETMANLTRQYTPRPMPDMEAGADEASAWLRRALRIADEVLASGDDDLGSAADFGQVEYEIDLLHQASHRASRYAQQSKQFLDGIFSSLALDLRAREGMSTLPPTDTDTPDTVTLLATATGAAGDRSDPMSMLRALASADAKNPSAEALSRVQTMGAPRQSTVATPRRQVAPRRSAYGRGTPAAGR